MGMAASQARYLGITARKINVEFEGQQVNQQRTALANESAGLFRRLLSLEVPTAPSQSDFYTDEYTFDDPTSADGKATVSGITENQGSDPRTYTVQITNKETVQQYGSTKNQNVSVVPSGTETGKYEIYLENGNHYELSSPINNISEDMAKQFNEIGGVSYNDASDTYYRFSIGDVTYYINSTESGFDTTLETQQNVDFFSVSNVQQDVIKTVENATLGTSSNGLYNQISWTDENGYSYSYSMVQSQTYDEQGYNDAMNEYNYNKELYQKEIEDINAKTEQLQETDRTLELRLKQLDTEQEALQTELDSVKKVIDKNVEAVFKTFQ